MMETGTDPYFILPIFQKFRLKLSNILKETSFSFSLFFAPQFLSLPLRTCGYRRNGTTASGSAGTSRLHPPWATGSSTSLYLVIYIHMHQCTQTVSVEFKGRMNRILLKKQCKKKKIPFVSSFIMVRVDSF